MTIVELTERAKASAKSRSEEKSRELLFAANILDRKTGGYSDKFFSKETVKASISKAEAKR